MPRFAFRETDEAATEITRLFDFVWPTAIALWNLRWQVAGFLDAVPDASYDDVASRFVAGSGIHGADIRAMSQTVSWDDQKARFAEFVLTNVFSIYESWARHLLSRTTITNLSDRDLYREGDRIKSGLFVFIQRVNASPSTVMQNSFQGKYLSHKKVYLNELDKMLKCYRYFKEIRNCHTHNGGLADQTAVDAYNDFHPISSASVLRTKETIEHYPCTLGMRTPISLRGVVGFCDIVLRLMITVDAAISGSTTAEKAAIERVKAVLTGPRPTLSTNTHNARRQVAGICQRSHLPKPAAPDEVKTLLVAHRLVSI